MRSPLYLFLASVTVLSTGGKLQWAVAAEAGTKGPAAQLVTSSPKSVDRGYDFATVMRGARLFRQNCAACHGQRAEGAPGWRVKGSDGKFPPPPLNGTAHTWHHPPEILKRTIKNGTIKVGGSMPAWGDKMTDREIDAVLAWIVSQWPDEIYKRWNKGSGHH